MTHDEWIDLGVKLVTKKGMNKLTVRKILTKIWLTGVDNGIIIANQAIDEGKRLRIPE
jgi:hypothetical protein